MARTLPCRFLLLLALFATPRPSAAQDPKAASPTTRLIPYSAVLPTAGADAAAGARTITFALFDEAEAGTLLWRETQSVSVDGRGRYSAHLGAVTALPIEIFRTEQARWLEVTVDGRALPRTMLVAVPYALRAADAETLGGTPASDFLRTDADGRRVLPDGTTGAPIVQGSGMPGQLTKWIGPTLVGSSVVTESVDNRIGVLAPDPTGGGVVDSRFTIRHLDNNTAFGVLNTLNQRRFALNTLATGGFQLYDGGSGTWNAGLQQVNGLVGIGSAPFNRLTVVDTSSIRSAAILRSSNTTGAFPAVQAITNASGNFALVAFNEGTGPGARTSVDGDAATSLTVDVPGTSTGSLIIGRRGFTNMFRVSATGAVFAASYTTGGADFAEELEPEGTSARSEPGDVLVIGTDRDRTVKPADAAYSTSVIGIHSTRPGIVASPYPADDSRRAGAVPVAMVGIVPCRVSAENGAIARGDLLVTSSTPGHAMKATDGARMTGAIVGKALEPLASGKGVILVAVTLQ